jgi:hypothetical protein
MSAVAGLGRRRQRRANLAADLKRAGHGDGCGFACRTDAGTRNHRPLLVQVVNQGMRLSAEMTDMEVKGLLGIALCRC